MSLYNFEKLIKPLENGEFEVRFTNERGVAVIDDEEGAIKIYKHKEPSHRVGDLFVILMSLLREGTIMGDYSRYFTKDIHNKYWQLTEEQTGKLEFYVSI